MRQDLNDVFLKSIIEWKCCSQLQILIMMKQFTDCNLGLHYQHKREYQLSREFIYL